MRHGLRPLAVWLAGWLIWAGSAAAEQSDPPRPAEIAKLIAQLGADEYQTRERAQERLAEIGAPAFDALAAAAGHADAEIAARARFLLGRIPVEVLRKSDPLAVRQQLEGYSSASEQDRQKRIEALAQLAGDEGLEALCRLARYESSEVHSKRAAMKIIAAGVPTSVDWARRAETIRRALGPSQRVAALWLSAYLDVNRGELTRAAESWVAFSRREVKTLTRSPQQSHVDVVVELLKYQIRLQQQLQRDKQARETFRQLVRYHPTKAERLVELIAWVRDQKAWTALDEVEKRFADRFATDPLLLYAMASGREAQGKTKLANEIADRAMAMNPGDQRSHYRVAVLLRNQGLIKWSEREYRHVMGLPPADNVYVMVAHYALGEMLHDQEKELAAAQVMESALAAMQRNVKSGKPDDNYGRELHGVRARMNYFYAKHYETSDRDKHIEHLDKALEADPTDADALIALYRLHKQDAARRAKTLAGIEKAVEAFREQMKKDPKNPTAYNQLAWLVGNTTGDFQEALRCSQKSLELRPNTSAYLDTLGRCFYAMRDYGNALKYQRMAVELEPHSAQMRRQLQLFQKAAAEAGGEKP